MSHKKLSESNDILTRLFAESLVSKKEVIKVCIFIAISRICLAFAPRLSGAITDVIVSPDKYGIEMDIFIGVCVVLGLAYLIGRGFETLVKIVLLDITERTVKVMRDRAYKKINALPISFLDSHPIGDLISRLTNDIQSVSNVLDATLRTVMGEGILLVGIIIIMIWINPVLTAIYLCVVPIGFGVSYLIIALNTKRIRSQIKLLGKLSAHTQDSLENYQMIKMYSCEDAMKERFSGINNQLYKEYLSTSFLTGFILPVSTMASNLCYIIQCVLGAMFLIKGYISIGEFQAFLIYGNMIQSPITDLANALSTIQSGKISAERVYEFLSQEEEEDETDKPHYDIKHVGGEITFNHVKFGYSPDKQLMKDVSFHVPKGKTVAIVGPTGAGKTTLVNLLMRFYDIWDGEILLDGKDIRTMNKQSVRQAFGMVLQDSWIFDGTIAENIAYGKPDASIEEIKEVAKRSLCDSFIENMTDKYETHINSGQTQLSAGMKQLISIARAMLVDPPILILDEATSQVDTRTEVLITNAITELIKNRTCFVIAHRLVTIRNADMILYMEHGNIEEIGDHDTLMKMNGKYAALYRENMASAS